ncbi:MAG TPA: MBL fold metallo-hydrolase [Treponemataceae bacterium]|nr:MBL fold metallo-hydrolase [Treponemataceae bacterium]
MNTERLVTGLFQVNTYLIPVSVKGQAGLVLVDPGGDFDCIVSQMNKMDRAPFAIMLTHGHFDHIGAVGALKKEFPSIHIAIHSGDKEYLGKKGYERQYADVCSLGIPALIESFKQNFLELPEPDILLEDGHMPFCMQGWNVLHTPGHSKGSICFYNEEKGLLLSGDTLFAGSCGRTDLYGGDMTAMNKSLQKLLALPSHVKVYPGHGSSTTIAREQNNYGV